MESSISWGWYLARSSGLVSFLLLYISIFLGLSIRTPVLNKIIKPIYSLKVHGWISLQALFFAAIHGISLLFDRFVDFNLGNIFIPFYPQKTLLVNPDFLALGVISFYIMLILVASSYARHLISHSVWRGLHFLNISLYVIVIIHALYLGTDLKEGVIRSVFIFANLFLAVLFVINIVYRLSKSVTNGNNNSLP